MDYQPLADKAVCRFVGWQGKNVAFTGRFILVKSVLTSKSVYFLTALKVPKEVLADLDRKRKKFL